uniref:J domain-containing protein n=1 Tax=Chloropicon laureae TaxID=464258 RepID=A0A7S2YZS1_9CHLO
MKVSSPYDVLGLQPGATLDEVKRAYRDKCMKLHPDVNTSGKTTTQDFVRVTNAYNYLTEVDRNQRLRWRSSSGERGGFGSGGQPYRHARPRFSKGVVALIIALPLALGGVRAGMAYDRVAAHNYRTNGLLEPAVNPFLSAEEARRLPVKKRQHARR